MAARKYFEGQTALREVAWWSVAARLALDSWERLVAKNVVLLDLNKRLDGAENWTAQREQHYAILGAAHVVRALELLEPPVAIDATTRTKISDARNIFEHWDEYRPIFNVTPRRLAPDRPSGRRYATEHARGTPFFALGWGARDGAILVPGLPASAVHGFLDDAEARAVNGRPELAEFIPIARRHRGCRIPMSTAGGLTGRSSTRPRNLLQVNAAGSLPG